MSAEIHVGDIGTLFKVTIKDEDDNIVNLSGASVKRLTFLKPDGVRVEKDCSFYTDGTDGIITYTSISGDISVAGIWRMQGYVKIGSAEHNSDTISFKVRSNI